VNIALWIASGLRPIAGRRSRFGRDPLRSGAYALMRVSGASAAAPAAIPDTTRVNWSWS
jgi:hypothetical protein